MFTRAFKKSSPFILNHRSYLNQSKPSISSSSQTLLDDKGSSCRNNGEEHNNNKKKKNKRGKLLRRSSSSGAVLAASCLGFSYYNLSLFDQNYNFVCFAETRNDNISWDSSNNDLDDDDNEDLLPPKQKKFLFNDSFRRRIFFNYEKRIRMQSPPEKVFEYFASLRTPEGEVLMTPADLMRAVVPVFPSSESDRVREGYLRGEPIPHNLHCEPSQFFRLFDTNNDGLISFPEYIFFVTILSIPESSFSVAFKMFDLNNNGEIDMDEFKRVMGLMRSQNRQGASHRDGQRIGLKLGGPVENGGLLEYFFGKDGKTCLQHGRFVQFLKDLHDEILRLEFAHYDFKKSGSISAKDFALSMVASADISHISKLLDRVDEMDNMPQLRKIRITFDEFKDFAELRRQLQSLSMAIFSYGKVNGTLSKSDFQRAASQVCGISITNNLVDVIFQVFDANRDGSLSSDEFISVLQRREKESFQPRKPGLKGFMSCCATCAKKYSSAKIV